MNGIQNANGRTTAACAQLQRERRDGELVPRGVRRGQRRGTESVLLHGDSRHGQQCPAAERVSANGRLHGPGLFAGSTYTVSLFSSNARGRSRPVVIQVSTAASPESQTRQDDMWQLSLNPMLLILCGAVGGLLFVILLIVILIKVHIVRTKRKDMASSSGNEK
ncbi:fibronectin type-III domain-containing protein [Caerostris extrusa]|uniref:Fibronectin type-III domain-containing protein n=1 Tax=Caerostris extrusa TaxID=172846 RepID=A0AAV4XVL3_CAEEX|nr:fibronectin type-III domain-containing protein [Caerostris extrusa]